MSTSRAAAPTATATPAVPVAAVASAHAATVYVEGDVLYAAMLADIAAAREAVRLESYIFCTDEIGARFVAALVERARAGCMVQLRIDDLGSLGGIDRAGEASLSEGGVRLKRCRRWNWRRFWVFQRRNHRKLLVVDEHACYVGGFNIHRESSLAAYGPARWRDTQVRLQGPVVADAVESFDSYGRRAPRPVVRDDVWLLPNRGHHGKRLLWRLLRQRFAGATRRIWVTSPYFVPDFRTRRALRRAAQRGVDVRVLVPGKTDVRLAQWAARAAYTLLLEAGVRIYEYRRRVLHAKTIVIDDNWATIGSANVDYRSFFINDEINAVFGAGPVLDELGRQFLDDLAQSDEIRERRWKRRPWSRLLAEAIGYLTRRWL